MAERTMTTIYAATGNAGKLAEFVASAQGADVEVLALPGIKQMPEPVEDAATYMGNAEIKAVAYSLLAPGKLVMADDSGLEVDALEGAPGIRSARFADDGGFTGSGTKDERNNAYLLERLHAAGTRGEVLSAARFVAALVIARDGEVLWSAYGTCEGQIISEYRGEGGFGYNPLFFMPETGKTMAEMSQQEKWTVSHRGRAFRELLQSIG
ncbi:non-canonical purine NTP pyrophosphatase [Granulicella cerasi]|uniref:dITP/XTP pyrophosphatase n=2 Tax=Granulicella cerasi TaxID=741063 RepID=A0ABW1ZCZ5_9BACT|nr:non-canonical purine NTP pyrophosphatase [Granulicella cerasi]